MSGFLKAYFPLLSAKLKKAGTWLMIVLLPLAFFLAEKNIPAAELAAPVQVGVALPAEGAEEFRRCLEERSGAVISFVFTDEDRLNGMVAAGLWDCGIVLPEDFEKRMEEMDTDSIISLRISESSRVHPLVRETVSAVMLRLLSPAIARDYMEKNGMVSERDFRAVLPEEQAVLIDMKTLDGEALQTPELASKGFDRLICTALFVFFAVWTLFAASDMCRWLESPAGKRSLAIRGRTVLLLPRLAAALTPLLISAAMSMLLLSKPLWAMLSLLPLAFMSGVLALLISRKSALASGLTILSPFVPFICILSLPGLLPIGKALPAGLFAEACGGSATALLGLWLYALAACLILILLEIKNTQ